MTTTTAFAPLALRAAFATIPQGIAALAAVGGDGSPLGMTASSLTPVSLEPPLISICIAETSTTWPRLRNCERLGVSVLSEAQSLEGRALSARHGDRFADVSWHASTDGAVLLDASVLALECSVEAEVPAGDHLIVVLRILSLAVDTELAPLVFHGSTFRGLTELVAS